MIQIVSANYIICKNKIYKNCETEINENLRANQKKTEAEGLRRKKSSYVCFSHFEDL